MFYISNLFLTIKSVSSWATRNLCSIVVTRGFPGNPSFFSGWLCVVGCWRPSNTLLVMFSGYLIKCFKQNLKNEKLTMKCSLSSTSFSQSSLLAASSASLSFSKYSSCSACLSKWPSSASSNAFIDSAFLFSF